MSKELELLREAVKLLEEKESQQTPCGKEDSRVELSSLNPGEVFKIAEHDFIVLEQTPGETRVISKGFMAENVVFDEDTRNYAESSLKKLIEQDIQPIIENAVGAENLVEHEVDLTSVDMQNEFGSCKCKVRPITFDEARKYNNLVADKSLNDWWWTCTPWSTEERGYKYSRAVVCPSGNFILNRCSFNFGVRPFCILKSNIFVSKGEQK